MKSVTLKRVPAKHGGTVTSELQLQKCEKQISIVYSYRFMVFVTAAQ